MTLDPSLFIKRIYQLSWALIVSGILNIGILSLFLYWVLRERPPTPYCELKPANSEQQLPPLADARDCTEVMTHLSQLSFQQLVNCLSRTQLIENGFAERDLALACLVGFHHFDIQRALLKNALPQQQRVLVWNAKGHESPINLVIYPDLTSEQYETLIHFATTESWPFSAKGLFQLLKNNKKEKAFDTTLRESFFLTSEFWTVELLFNRSKRHINKDEILTVLLDGDWNLLKKFSEQQRQIHDTSEARRQKFLLDYINEGSPSAVMLLLKNERDFAAKKLNDHQIIAILKWMPLHFSEGIEFAKEMLASPRSVNVWRQASLWLYRQAGEGMPNDWTHLAALKRFVPEKASLELISKPIPPIPAPIAPPLPLPPTKMAKATPMKTKPPEKKPPVPIQKPNESSIKPRKELIAGKKPQESLAVKKTQESFAAKKPQESFFAKPSVYIVQQGDTLWKIAKLFNVKVEDIRKLNQLKSDSLKIGTPLQLPVLLKK